MHTFKSQAVYLMIVVLTLSACSQDAEEASGGSAASGGILRYVPADTPYLIAMTEPLPDDVRDKLEPQVNATLQMYPALIKGMLSAMIESEEEGTDTDALREALPFVDELGSLMSLEGLRESGIDNDSSFVMYGAGVLPVVRVTLTDGALMEKAVARLEESATKKMSVATIDNQEYRYAGDEEARVIVAIVGDELVISLVPAELSEESLKTVLGLSLPDENIAESGTLAALASKYGFSDFLIGFVDIERIASVLLDQQSGINAELLSMIEDDGLDLSDVCKAEARSMAGVMPRIVVGYTDIDTSKFSSKAIFELRPDLAAGVSKLTAPVPGMGSDLGGIFSLGMSTNILAAREFYAERLDAMEAEPYECQDFAEIQAGVVAGREMLNQPVPPIVYGFNGFLAVIEDIQGLDLQTQQPPTSIDMRLLISMNNVEGLLAMGAMFSPELAALDIEPNGEPVELKLGQLAAMGQTVHVAMTDGALALSVGEGTEDRLGDMLDANAAKPSPFMTFDMDAARYYEFIGESMTAGQETGASPEMQAAVQKMLASVQEGVDRMSVTIDFTENGIEMNSTVTLAD